MTTHSSTSAGAVTCETLLRMVLAAFKSNPVVLSAGVLRETKAHMEDARCEMARLLELAR